jgi:hypothetical protein
VPAIGPDHVDNRTNASGKETIRVVKVMMDSTPRLDTVASKDCLRHSHSSGC